MLSVEMAEVGHRCCAYQLGIFGNSYCKCWLTLSPRAWDYEGGFPFGSRVVHDATKCNISINVLRLIMVHFSYEVYTVSGLGRRNVDIILIDLYRATRTSL